MQCSGVVVAVPLVLATSHITHEVLRPIGVRIGDLGESLAGVAAWATIADWLCLA